MTCLICKKTSVTTTIGGQKFLKCVGCGHYQAYDILTAGHLINEHAPSNENKTIGVLDRFKLAVIRSVLGNGEFKILDIGCASGSFVNASRNEGFDAQGVEPSPMPRKWACDVFKLDVYESIFCEELQNHCYDAVTLWHSLEHVNPNEINITLSRIAELIRPRGFVVISVPNGAAFTARLFGSKNAFFDPSYHWHQFTLRSLDHLLKDYGFKRDRKVFSWPYNVFCIIQSILNWFFEKNYLYTRLKRNTSKLNLFLMLLNLLIVGITAPIIFCFVLFEIIFDSKQSCLTVVYKNEKVA